MYVSVYSGPPQDLANLLASWAAAYLDPNTLQSSLKGVVHARSR
jgi:hypothetical protein